MSTDQDGCCRAGDEPVRDNPPRQPTIRYRVGTQPEFLARMIADLPRREVPGAEPGDAPSRPLAALTTRSLDDGVIAVLDAFACVCDVLTFYGERALNEGFVRTAVRRLSVHELARSIGYQPHPGVAASTRLAFTLETAPTSAKKVDVPEGTAVASVPMADEQMQVFETIEPLEARGEWNALRAARTRTQVIDHTSTQLYLKGVATRLSVGDALLVVGRRRTQDHGAQLTERWDLRFVTEVELDHAGDSTLVQLDRALGDHENMPDPPGLPRTHPASLDQQVFVFRARGSLFGFNAPDLRALSADVRKEFGASGKTKWPGFDLASDTTVSKYLAADEPQGVIDLDREYPDIVVRSWICLQDRTEVESYRVTKVSPTSREDFTLTAKCTRVFLDGYERLTRFKRRSTVVHHASEELTIAAEPWTTSVAGTSVELDRLVTPMPAGRVVLVQGVDVATEEVAVETATVKACHTTSDGTRTVVEFMVALAGEYRRDSLQILGNVAMATHGETVSQEYLGSGDAATAHQRFELRQTPSLTYVADGSGAGAISTAQVWIDGARWSAVPRLLDAGPRDKVYELRTAFDGRAIVQLGDGIRGARATTGVENVVARYRKGTGLVGEVAAGQLTLLRTRPLGVSSVTNPLPAGGAADAQAHDDIRGQAPRTVLTMDRLVSVSDYEDYAAGFPGVGKARAVRLWDGKRTFVHVTVASASGKVLDPAGTTVTDLRTAIERWADPSHVALVDIHHEVRFGVRVRVKTDPARRKDDIKAEIVAQLLVAFGFSERGFGQPVQASEVVTALHAVAGVLAVDLEALYRRWTSQIPRPRLAAASPVWDGTTVTRAELLLVDPDLLDVHWMD